MSDVHLTYADVLNMRTILITHEVAVDQRLIDLVKRFETHEHELTREEVDELAYLFLQAILWHGKPIISAETDPIIRPKISAKIAELSFGSLISKAIE